MKQIPWTESEKALLKANYPHKSNEDVAAIIGRTSFAVDHKARKMGVKKSKEYLRTLAREINLTGQFVTKQPDQEIKVQFETRPDNAHPGTPAGTHGPARCFNCEHAHVNAYLFPCNECKVISPRFQNSHFIMKQSPVVTEQKKPGFWKRLFRMGKSAAC